MGIPLLRWTEPAIKARDILKKHHSGSISTKDTLIVLNDSGVPTTAEVHDRHATVTNLVSKPREHDKEYALDILTELFGGFKEKINFVPGAAHPKYPGRFHPDDYDAYLTIGEVCKKIVVDPRSVTLNPYVFSSENLRGSFALTGGPYSNYLSSLILQYGQIFPGKQEQGLKREAEPVVRLKYQFSCDPRDLQLRGVRSAPDMEEPNWIILNTEDENDFLVPDIEEINGKHFQRNDYLVVYALPNFTNIEAYHEGKKLFLFCGVHGLGSMAVDLLFRDKEILSFLYEYLTKENYCEAIFKINSIDCSNQRLRPRSLSEKSEDIRFATPTFDDTNLRKWLNNLPYKKKYTQGTGLTCLDRTQGESIVEKLNGGSKEFFSNYPKPNDHSLSLGIRVTDDSLGGENTMSLQQNEYLNNLYFQDRGDPESPASRQSDTSAVVHRINRKGRVFYLVEKIGPGAAPYGLQFAHTQNGKIAVFRTLADAETYIARFGLSLEPDEVHMDLNEVLKWVKDEKSTPPSLAVLRDVWYLIVVAGISQEVVRQKVGEIIDIWKNHDILSTLGRDTETLKPTSLSVEEQDKIRALIGTGLKQFDLASEAV